MQTVYISPSQAQFYSGAAGFGTVEQRMNLIADVVEYELIRHGVPTARNDPALSPIEAVADANAARAEIYVGISSQSADTKRAGAQVYYYRPGGNGERLASEILSRLSNITPFEDRLSEGSKAYGGLGFYELRRTRMPAALVFVGYHDNPQDAEFVINSVYEIGVQIAKGILDYLGVDYRPDTPENTENLRQSYNGVKL